MTPTTPFCEMTTQHLQHLKDQAQELLTHNPEYWTSANFSADAVSADLEDIEAELNSRGKS